MQKIPEKIIWNTLHKDRKQKEDKGYGRQTIKAQHVYKQSFSRIWKEGENQENQNSPLKRK